MAMLASPVTWMWSPRVRGCSRSRRTKAKGIWVVPARAGVFPARRSPRRAAARGPRACGGVPGPPARRASSPGWSPRVRGCSRFGSYPPLRRGVVPARAGVVPSPRRSARPPPSGPRACGGVVPALRSGAPVRGGPARAWAHPRTAARRRARWSQTRRRSAYASGRPGRSAQLKGTASVGAVCQLVTTGLSTVIVPTWRETGFGSSLPTATMRLSISLPPSVLVLFGFTPA